MPKSKKLLVSLNVLFFILALCFASDGTCKEDPDNEKYKTYGAAQARKVTQEEAKWITADHSKHEALQKDFNTGPQVTESCLSCHNEAAEQIQETIHWTWICPADPNEEMGKNGISMNNF